MSVVYIMQMREVLDVIASTLSLFLLNLGFKLKHDLFLAKSDLCQKNLKSFLHNEPYHGNSNIFFLSAVSAVLFSQSILNKRTWNIV